MIMLKTLFTFPQFIIELRFKIFQVGNGGRLDLLLISERFCNLVIDLVEYLQVLCALFSLQLLAQSCSLLLEEGLAFLSVAFRFVLEFALQLLDLVLDFNLEAAGLLSDGVVHLESGLGDEVIPHRGQGRLHSLLYD